MKVAIGEYNDDGSERFTKVILDPWDTWSLDHTLALIIAPALRQLKETSCSSMRVEDRDVPRELQREMFCNDMYDVDDHWEARSNWILDEMIFAFETIAGTEDDIDWDDNTEFRVNRGLKLFGKYYRNLWD